MQPYLFVLKYAKIQDSVTSGPIINGCTELLAIMDVSVKEWDWGQHKALR